MTEPSLVRTSTAELYDAYVLKNYGRPALTLVRGSGAQVWDDAGNRYLDFTSGIAVSALGHCHPHWVAAVQRQAAELIHVSNLFRNPNQGDWPWHVHAVAMSDPDLSTGAQHQVGQYYQGLDGLGSGADYGPKVHPIRTWEEYKRHRG